MKQMEYFEAGRKDPEAYQNICCFKMYSKYIFKMLPCARNKMTVLGKATANQTSNIPQDFTPHSFGQHYSFSAWYIYSGRCTMGWKLFIHIYKDKSRHCPK